MTIYTWRHRGSGYERASELALAWEVHLDPITDDYVPEETSAEDLWHLWRRRHPADERSAAVFGPGAFRVWWFVTGDGTFDAAPWQDSRGVESALDADFLQHFIWPEDADGTPVQWMRLPVVDKLWRPGRADKGGFIQEATGWKPAPLQPFVNVPLLERASGLV